MRRGHHLSTVCAVPACGPGAGQHPELIRGAGALLLRLLQPRGGAVPLPGLLGHVDERVEGDGVRRDALLLHARHGVARAATAAAPCDAMSELYVCTVRRAPLSVISANARSTSSPLPLTCSARPKRVVRVRHAAPGRVGGAAPGYVHAATRRWILLPSNCRRLALARRAGFAARSVPPPPRAGARTGRPGRWRPRHAIPAAFARRRFRERRRFRRRTPRRRAAFASARASTAACSFSMPHRQSSVMASGTCPDLRSSRNTVATSSQSRSAEAPLSMVLCMTSVG